MNMKNNVILLVTIVILLIGKTSNAQDSFIYNSSSDDEVCHLALMIPLYLEQVDEEFCEETPNNKMLLTKPFSFLHFYEGFMIAVDSMVNSRGMKLDLKVYDVDNDVNKALAAIGDPWIAEADVIVGPFYIKPFEKVKEYANQNNILIVNPITQRSNIVENHPKVVKVKPSLESQVIYLESLIKKHYHSNNVFIVGRDGLVDDEMMVQINDVVENNIDEVSYVDNSHIVNVIKRHQKRWSMLEVDFDESDFLTDNVSLNIEMLKRNINDSTSFKNYIVNINYSRDSLHNVKKYASLLRNNLFIVYGNDKIFADEVVNKLTKLTEYYPITVVMLPEWSKFDRLFNENLMKMKAIYFDDNFIDYQSVKVLSFVNKFRAKYGSEPQKQAFQGFDIGWYFLNACKYYGADVEDVLQYFSVPLLQSEFHFRKNGENDGYENVFWNVYQFRDYDKIPIELKITTE